MRALAARASQSPDQLRESMTGEPVAQGQDQLRQSMTSQPVAAPMTSQGLFDQILRSQQQQHFDGEDAPQQMTPGSTLQGAIMNQVSGWQPGDSMQMPGEQDGAEASARVSPDSNYLVDMQPPPKAPEHQGGFGIGQRIMHFLKGAGVGFMAGGLGGAIAGGVGSAITPNFYHNLRHRLATLPNYQAQHQAEALYGQHKTQQRAGIASITGVDPETGMITPLADSRRTKQELADYKTRAALNQKDRSLDQKDRSLEQTDTRLGYMGRRTTAQETDINRKRAYTLARIGGPGYVIPKEYADQLGLPELGGMKVYKKEGRNVQLKDRQGNYFRWNPETNKVDPINYKGSQVQGYVPQPREASSVGGPRGLATMKGRYEREKTAAVKLDAEVQSLQGMYDKGLRFYKNQPLESLIQQKKTEAARAHQQKDSTRGDMQSIYPNDIEIDQADPSNVRLKPHAAQKVAASVPENVRKKEYQKRADQVMKGNDTPEVKQQKLAQLRDLYQIKQ